MKTKIFSYALAASALLGWNACSDEVEQVGGEGDGNVSLTVSLPSGMNTRSFADGKKATKLTYAVYNADGQLVGEEAKSKTFDDNSLTTTVSLKLINGKTYNIVFWADCGENSPYSFSAEKGTIAVDYSDLASNDDNRDAFYKTVTLKVDPENASTKVTLKRPFAQINFGTDDLDGEGAVETYNNLKTKLVVNGAYNTLNLITGEASGSENVEFPASEPPSDEEIFPVMKDDGEGNNTLKYLAMNYLLVGADQETQEVKDMDFYIYDGDTQINHIDLNAVPVKRNYRTNIYGSLLYSQQDFTIEIVPETDADNNVDLYGEKIAEGVFYKEEEKTYSLASKEGLLWFANTFKQTRSGSVTFSNQTVQLIADVDLNGVEWEPIYSGINNPAVFDGGNHVISNLTVNSTENAGLFSYFSGTTIKNLRIKNPNITTNKQAGVVIGSALAVTIENCHVEGGSVTSVPHKLANDIMDDGNKVGGIVGYLSAQNSASIKDCSVSNMTVKGYRQVGALVGCAQNEAVVISGNKASNVTVICDRNVENYGDVEKIDEPGEIVGSLIGTKKEGEEGYIPPAKLGEGNVATNVTLIIQELLDATAMAKGGEFEVNVPMQKLDLVNLAPSGDESKEITVELNNEVAEMTIGEFSSPVTVKVAAGVPYPKFTKVTATTRTKGTGIIKNLTIEGTLDNPYHLDCTSLTSGHQFDFSQGAENLTVKNVVFDGQIFAQNQKKDEKPTNYQYKNVSFENCVINADKSLGISITGPVENSECTVSIIGCTVNVLETATSNSSGIYLMNVKDLTVKDCKVNNAKYNGIVVRPTESCVVSNNVVTASLKDGIKVEAHTGMTTCTVTGNKVIQNQGNGIRVKNPDTATAITITGNTVDMSKATEHKITQEDPQGEPWGILVYCQSGNNPAENLVLTVKDNVKKNSPTWDKWFQKYGMDMVAEPANPFK